MKKRFLRLRRRAARLLCFALAAAVFCAVSLCPAAEAAGVRYAGDVNGDGAVTAEDARLTLRCAIELSYAPDEILSFFDADGDGEISAEDARLILRTAVGLEERTNLHSFSAPVLYYGNDIPWYAKTVVKTLYPTASARLNLGEAHVRRTGTQYRWSSSNPAVASVSASGEVTAIKKGFACVSLISGQNRYYYFLHVRSALQEQIYALQDKYPAGYYWNAHEKSKIYPAVSEIPCSDHESGRYAYCIGQCAGFASLLSDEVFGEYAPVTAITDKNNIKIGDYLRMLPSHSVFVIDRVNKGEVTGYDIYADKNETAPETYITVAECNWDWHCGIGWGRTIALENVRLDFDNPWFESYSRY